MPIRPPGKLRAVGLLVRTAATTAPWQSAGTLLEPLGQLAGPATALALGLLVDATVHGDFPRAAWSLAALLAAQALRWAMTFLGTDLRITLSEKVGFAFDREITRLCATAPSLALHEDPEAQDRLELLRQGQGLLAGSMNTLVNTANSVIVAAGSLAVLARMHPVLLLLVLFALPAVPLARADQARRRRAEEEAAPAARRARYLRTLAYRRDAGMEFRVFHVQDTVRTMAADAWREAKRPLLAAERRGARHAAARDLVFLAGVLAAVLHTLRRVGRGEASIADLVTLVYLSQTLQSMVLSPVNALAGLGPTLRAAERFGWLRDRVERECAERAAGTAPPPARPARGITLDGVAFAYPGSERPVLAGIDLEIPAGSVVAVVGENGSGKTTLVKLLMGLHVPTAGTVAVDGVPLGDLDQRAWRAASAGAFQDFARFELLVRESVGVGDLSAIDDAARVRRAVDRADAGPVVDALPAGLATQIGVAWQDGTDLSVGQWQRLALARGVMAEAPLVRFFDEPTASLDAETENAIFEKITDAAREAKAAGGITVLVSHRFSTVRGADLIVVLEAGRIAESGTHDALLARGGTYAELYRMQADSYAP